MGQLSHNHMDIGCPREKSLQTASASRWQRHWQRANGLKAETGTRRSESGNLKPESGETSNIQHRSKIET
jgi:hypothetical protein